MCFISHQILTGNNSIDDNSNSENERRQSGEIASVYIHLNVVNKRYISKIWLTQEKITKGYYYIVLA